jgi:hypothetical protein
MGAPAAADVGSRAGADVGSGAAANVEAPSAMDVQRFKNNLTSCVITFQVSFVIL